MKILGIDTSTRFLSIGVCDGGRVYEYNLDAGRLHSALLIPTIQRIIGALGWSLAQVDYFACGIGPGSFTGVRIAASTVKGLAYSLRKPIIPILSLDIIAENACRAGIQGHARIIPIVDAKRNLVYSGVYQYNNGVLQRIGAGRLSTIAEVIKACKGACFCLGDGLGIYQREISGAGMRTLDKDYWYPTGRAIISAALANLKKKNTTDAFRLRPEYLYPKECQIKQA